MKKIFLDTYSFHLACDVWKPQVGEPRDLFWILEQAFEMGFDGIHTADMGHFTGTITPEAFNTELGDKEFTFGTGGSDPAHLSRMISLAETFGHKVFRTFINRGVTSEKVRALKEIMPAAEKADIIVAIENHQDLTSGELLEVIREVGSSHLGVCLDLGNALGVMEEPLAACEALAPYTFITHIKEYTVYPARMGYVFWSVPEGQGSCSVREQLEILFDKSPWGKDLPLNLEAPVEFFDKSGQNAQHIPAAVPRLSPESPPRFMSWTPKQALQAELELIRESLAGLRDILDQMGA